MDRRPRRRGRGVAVDGGEEARSLSGLRRSALRIIVGAVGTAVLASIGGRIEGASCIAVWLLLFGGLEHIEGWVGITRPVGDAARRAVLVAFIGLTYLRMTTMILVLLKRNIGWEEAISVPCGFVPSEASPEMLAAAYGAGAKFMIRKPFKVETFRHELAGVL